MKKILLSVLLTAATAAQAQQTFKTGPFTYSVTSPTTVELTDADDDDASGAPIASYDVPETVKASLDGGAETTYTVTSIGEEAFKWSDASSVTLPASIDSIKKSAFNGMKSLTKITLPEHLSYIGDYAFSSTGLTSVTFPDAVEEIGSSAFFTCSNLTEVTFGNGLKRMGKSVFYKAPIVTAALPESLTEVPDKVFLMCDKLTSATISSKAVSLGEGVFNGCSSLTSVNIPATVRKINDECFLDCKSLTSFEIPASTDILGTSVFARSGITSLTVAAANKSFTIDGGALYSANKRMLFAVPCKGLGKVDVAKGCIGINGGAFWGSEVKNVTLPEGFLAVDDYAFCQSALETINFPSTMTYAGEQAFASTKLSGDLVLPENLVNVYDGTFAGITGITSVTIPSGVKGIANHAFHQSTGIKKFVCLGSEAPVIDDVYEDYDSPFYGLDKSVTVTVPKGSVQSYDDAYWGDFLTIEESTVGVFKHVSTSPADESTVKPGWQSMSFDIVFGEPVTIVNDSPEAFLRVGSEVSGDLVEPDDKWVASKGDNNNTLRVWAADYDGYNMSYQTVADEDYYVCIPAGVVKNAAGETNEKIVIEIECKTPTGIDSTPKTSDATVVSRYNIGGQRIGKASRGVSIEKLSDGSVRKVIVR